MKTDGQKETKERDEWRERPIQKHIHIGLTNQEAEKTRKKGTE